MRLRVGVWAAVVAIAACGDLGGPGGPALRLSITPVFDSHAELASDADQLRIRLFRVNPGPPRDSVQVKDTTVTVDAQGNAAADINVVLLQSPQFFRVRLDAVRTTANTVLFSGSQVVSVTSGSATGSGQSVNIPVAWTGPVGTRIVIAPRDTTIAASGSFALRATVFNAQNQVIGSSPRFYLVSAADASRLAVNRLTGLVSAVPGATGQVLVYVETLDVTPPRDTARIFIGAVPASVRITPGFGNVGAGQTLALTGAVLDANGNAVPGSTVTWTSRTPGVATVNTTGQVSGVAAGTSVVVATAGALADSVRVTVPPSTNVVVSAAPRARSFGSPAVNDTITVEITADMRFTPGDKLGSYNAKLTWNPAQLQLEAVGAGDSGFNPTFNDQNKAAGQLTFADANASGAAGTPVVARVRFKALASGNAALALTLTELSAAAPTFTNLFAANRVTVTNGIVTVR